jgi:hypothetical protein
MSNNNNNNTKGDTLAWIAKSLPSHAERQVATYKEVMEAGFFSEDDDSMVEMRDAVKAVAQRKSQEWSEGVSSTLAGEIQAINRLAEKITTPGRAANAIGRVTGNDVRVVKWRIVGDPKAVYCVKHSSPKSPTTRGHTYLDMETGNTLGTLCQKCVSELSNKKGQHQLRRLLERSGKLKSTGDRRGSRKEEKSETAEELAARLIAGEESERPPIKEDLSLLTVGDLRQLARSKKIKPLPLLKADLIKAILEA